MARWNVITNIGNGCGLQRDSELMCDVLRELGHAPTPIQFNDPQGIAAADANVFMEVVVPTLFRYAPRQFVFPNREWWFGGWNPHLPDFERILCKTADCYRLFEKLATPAKCRVTGFYSRDLYDGSITRERRFLHVAGKSQSKNTLAVMEAWKQFHLPPLTIVAENYSGTIPNVNFFSRVGEAEIRTLMNCHLFHLMPSGYEGWGHALHEGMGCGAVVLTTNRPPMSEVPGLPKELLIESKEFREQQHAPLWQVEPKAIQDAVNRAVSMSLEKVNIAQIQARNEFLSERKRFLEAFRSVA